MLLEVVPGQTYTVGFDAMSRPATLTGSHGFATVAGVAYNAANQPLQTQFQRATGANQFFWENRGYNALNQLAVLNNFNTIAPQVNSTVLNLTYNFSANQDNGQIGSVTDTALSQTVTYGYHALKRLTSASASGPGGRSQSYTYDGFGNMTSKTGSGAVFTNNVDVTTNRLAGPNICYDPDGNLVSAQNGGGCGNPNYAYDIGSRMKVTGGGTE